MQDDRGAEPNVFKIFHYTLARELRILVSHTTLVGPRQVVLICLWVSIPYHLTPAAFAF